jgi:AraC-like DNA-binding protein
LKERDLPQNSPGPAQGVLRTLPQGVQHKRWAVRPDLAPWIEHIWWVQWDLEQPFDVQTLPHPAVHFTLEQQGWIGGPSTAPFTRTLRGEGEVLGIKFRPGGFRDWSTSSVHLLADRRVLALEAVGALAAPLWGVWQQELPATQRSVQLQALLSEHKPKLSPGTLEIQQWMAWIQDPELRRVEHLAKRAGLGLRAIQRRFKEWVGVSPKWVLRRVRMLRAVEAIKAQQFTDLSTLAFELGYADQAHFSRDFRATVGMPPSVFLAQVYRP